MITVSDVQEEVGRPLSDYELIISSLAISSGCSLDAVVKQIKEESNRNVDNEKYV